MTYTTYTETLLQAIPETEPDVMLLAVAVKAAGTLSTNGGHTTQVGEHIGGGWWKLYGLAPMPSDIMEALNTPQVVGRIGLCIHISGRTEPVWQYDGAPEYCGGDGPASNAAVLLRNRA